MTVTPSDSRPSVCSALPTSDYSRALCRCLCRRGLVSLTSSRAGQLEEVCRHRLLRDEADDIRFRLSDESLSLLPEYWLRVNVLKRLGYVDNNNVGKFFALEVSS